LNLPTGALKRGRSGTLASKDIAMPDPDHPIAALDATDRPAVRLRVVFPGGFMIGPGKAELLERIAATGSISAAGREMGMSYKRAWLLVETMNTAFREPVVESLRGGAKGGGARLTENGQAVVAAYRQIVAGAEAGGRRAIEDLSARLVDMSEQK
jgi:molybdate transport system regulatory protein